VGERPVLTRALWRAYLGFGVLAVGAYFAVPGGPHEQAAVYDAIGFSAAAAVLVGMRLHRPAGGAAWPLIAVGVLLASCGNVVWQLAPGLSDAVYLAAYGLQTVGIGLLARLRGRPRAGDVLDGTIVVAGGALLMWLLLIDRTLHQPGVATADRALAAAYPAMDLLLFAALVYFVVGAARLSRVYQTLAVAFALLLATDAVWGRLRLSGGYEPGSWLDAGWLVAYVLAGTALLHPGIAAQAAQRTRTTALSSHWRRLTLMAAASLVAPAALAFQAAAGRRIEVDATVALSVAITVLTFVRLGLLLRDHVAALEAQRTSERRLRLALESTGTTYWEWSPGTGAFSSVAHRDEVMPVAGHGDLARWIEERVAPDDRALVARAVGQAVEAGVPCSFEYRLLVEDGPPRWIETQGYPLPDGRVVGLSRDVSDRKRLEEQFHQAQKMEAVGQLAGGIAHDFNNLLTAILGYCGLARDSLDGAAAYPRDRLGRAIDAAERAEALTQQLLAFSRRQRLDPKVLDLGVVLARTHDLLRRLIGERVELAIDPRASGRVRADDGQLTQVLVNLAVNARDAMPDGGTISIETDDVELLGESKRGGFVRLRVRDTGCGMDDETLRHAFEPFFTTKAVGEGTGLGLATVYGIVTQSGGHIEVASSPGAGSTFSIFLPRTEALPVEEPAAPQVSELARGSERILVVEDEAAVRELVVETLADEGYRVTAAAGAIEALPLAVAEAFDVVITDLVMPEMSGEQLAAALAALDPAPRLILMSGYAYDTLSPHALDAPFLRKPFALAELRALVRQTLDADREPAVAA
jgi:signal transduction histidine kinase/ActR/RegA family two-component response regulator